MRHLRAFTAVPRPLNTILITPRWVFSLELREWLTRPAQGTPSRTRIRPSLRCRLYGTPPICPGDATRIFFRVLASIATPPGLNLRLFDVSAAHLHGDIDGEVYMESPSEYGD